MLTIKECRKLVDPKNEKFTDKELELMLDFLSDLMTTIIKDIKSEYNEKSRIDGPRVK
ncbi:hypothetical protein OAE48_02215 [Flavobacteriales bacterium]|nr:hypothetical protein [Flavobacteriales bacterium]